MAHVLIREAARRDVIQQWVRYAENAGMDVADRFLRADDNTLDLLSTQPESGAAFFVRQPELQNMRRFPVSDGFGKILLFYFPLLDGVDLVRVAHGGRDLERLLVEGFFD